MQYESVSIGHENVVLRPTESEITHGAVGHAASEMYATNDYLEIRLFKIASRTYKYTGIFDILVK